MVIYPTRQKCRETSCNTDRQIRIELDNLQECSQIPIPNLIHYDTVGWHSTAIMISTLNALVDYSVSPDGDLFNVSWKACKAKRDRSSILHQVLKVLRPVTPGPLELKFSIPATLWQDAKDMLQRSSIHCLHKWNMYGLKLPG
jgi:hypothetical protein